MKKIIYIILLSIILSGCKDKEITKNDYQVITQEKAYEMMTSNEIDENFIILDVRNTEEFAESRIDGSINVPLMSIENKIETIIPNKNSTILVYCKSGVRAKLASETLVNLGYTNVYDFGGIDTWSYGLVNLIE